MARWLGVDHGTRRIGVAVCDSAESIASPLTAIPAGRSARQTAEAVANVARDEGVAGIVVGLPLNMDGSEGPQARAAREFAEALRAAGGLPVELWDERLSSFQADEHLERMDAGARKRPGARDALAAQVILQAFLDDRRRPMRSDES